MLTDIRMPPTGTDEGIRAAADAARQPSRRRRRRAVASTPSPPTRSSCSTAAREGRAYLLKERLSDGEPAGRRPPRGRRRRIGRRSQGGRGARRRPPPGARVPLERLTPRETRGAGRDRPGQEQRRGRPVAGALGAGRREAHQLAVLQARPERGARRPPPGQGRPALPRRPPTTRSLTHSVRSATAGRVRAADRPGPSAARLATASVSSTTATIAPTLHGRGSKPTPRSSTIPTLHVTPAETGRRVESPTTSANTVDHALRAIQRRGITWRRVNPSDFSTPICRRSRRTEVTSAWIHSQHPRARRRPAL